MEHQNNNISSIAKNRSTSAPIRVATAWFVILVALALAGWTGEFAEGHWNITGRARYGLQAAIMSGIVLPGIWLLRKLLDRGTPKSIGVGDVRQALVKFGLGIGLFLVPLILTMLLTTLFGWGNININTSDTMLETLLIGVSTVLFFEALPEELVFRGYIYSNLNTVFKRWQAALFTIGLFILLPTLLVSIQQYVLGMKVYVGGASSITGSYIITMFFFGAFVQYLRILTNSIWTGIGFHLIFVYINRLIGTEPTDFIQFTDITNETPMQITLITSLAVIFIALLFYPRIAKYKIGWGELKN